MRTSVLGTVSFHSLDAVRENTLLVCKTTHADPRCQASCVATTSAIALMLQGGRQRAAAGGGSGVGGGSGW
jgi:ADP-ribosylglycohydrolase